MDVEIDDLSEADPAIIDEAISDMRDEFALQLSEVLWEYVDVMIPSQTTAVSVEVVG